MMRLFNTWRPHLHVDNHVTDGVDHECCVQRQDRTSHADRRPAQTPAYQGEGKKSENPAHGHPLSGDQDSTAKR